MKTLGSAMLDFSKPSRGETGFLKIGFLKPEFLVYSQASVLFLLAAWLYGPLAIGLASQWWHDPNYTHGFFVPVFSLFLLWERRAKLAALPSQPAWSGLVILLFALLALVVSTITQGFFLYRISFLLFIVGHGGLSGRMEAPGGDLVSAGVSRPDDSFLHIAGARSLFRFRLLPPRPRVSC